jgi:hypothetical protein
MLNVHVVLLDVLLRDDYFMMSIWWGVYVLLWDLARYSVIDRIPALGRWEALVTWQQPPVSQRPARRLRNLAPLATARA